MLPSQTAEIKQQAILEKAKDPSSSVSPEAAEEAVVQESKKAGVAAFQFDPDASTEAKVAQMNAQIPQGLKPTLENKAAVLASDADSGSATYDLPPPTTAGAVKSPVDDAEKAAQQQQDVADDEKFWKIVGWAPRFGDAIPADLDLGTSLSDQQTWLEGRLHDRWFGDWYFNAGIIMFACLASWSIAVIGGGLGWVILVMATCGTYYRTSVRRVRRNFRDDIRREMAKERLETDTETLEWINSFLVKFWPIYAPVLCKTIVQSVDQVLSVATPPMVESLKLKTFTLGTKPPRLEHVRTYPKSEDDIVLMDWKFSFNPNDTADMTARQLKVKQNPKIVLEVRVGVGVVSKGLDVIVEDMACEGVMRVKVKLQLEFPHVERVEICFLQKPIIDYVCKPLGGDTFGFDINFIPGLEHFILEQIHANLAPMMYDPNVFPIEIAKMLAGNPVDQAIGVVQITFHGAQGLKNPDQFAGTPDPYATIKINDRQELARTKTVKENANPRWNETVNLIVSSLKDTLNFHVYDCNEFRKDRELGVAAFPLEKLQVEDEYENEQLELVLNGKARGVVQADIRYFPVLEPTKLEDGTIEPAPETMTGIARFEVERAKDLDGTKSLIGLLNPYAVLLLNGKEVHITEKLKRTNSPIWANNNKELLITNRRTAKLGLVLKDDRELATDPIIGSYQIKLDDLLEMSSKGQEWYDLSGVKTGRAKMKLTWRPVDIKGALGGAGGYVKPIGVMRIYCQNARDLRNVETVGKSDPYVRALLSGVQKGRTVTWKNNLNPDFDEVIYVPVHTTREKLTIEIMDEENMGRDRSLGHFEIPLKEYIERDGTGEYVTNHSKKIIPQALQSGRGRSPKGILNCSCSFFPCVPTTDPDEEEREREKEARKSVETPRQSIDSFQTADTPKKSMDILKKLPETPKKSMEGQKETPGSATKSVGENSIDSTRKPDLNGVPERPKLNITADNLMDYGWSAELDPFDYDKSGLVIFTLVDGDLVRPNCHLEVLMDDHVFPSYSSNKVRSRHHEFHETGDAMVRELDASNITLRLIEQVDREGKGSDKNVIAKLSGPTLQTLQKCLYNPTQLTLRDDQGAESKVRVKLKFIPVKMQLDPSESFRNMGKVKVEVLDGANLPAADRNGYSDPYCKFTLNGKEVHKTDIKKKTLNPAWNEVFETAIRSRTAAKFEVEVWDWDMTGSNDFLGKSSIDLAALEPYERKLVELKLDGKSGTVNVRLLFTPEYITRQRQGSSTFHGTFVGAGKVAGAPVKTIGKVGGVVGGGVVKTGSLLGRGFRRRKSRAGSEFEGDDSGNGTPTGTETPPLPTSSPMFGSSISGQAPETPSPHLRTPSRHSLAGLSINGMDRSVDTGTATITVLSATGFPPSTNVRVHVRIEGGKHPKEVHKTKAIKSPTGDVRFEQSAETFRVPCAADTQFRIIVKNHSTLSRDDEVGEGVFFVADQGSGAEQTVMMNDGKAKVIIKSAFETAERSSLSGSGGGSARLSRMAWGGSRRDTARGGTPGS